MVGLVFYSSALMITIIFLLIYYRKSELNEYDYFRLIMTCENIANDDLVSSDLRYKYEQLAKRLKKDMKKHGYRYPDKKKSE